MKDTSWHTLDVAGLKQTLGCELERGLSSAEVASRLQQYGPNQLEDRGRSPFWQMFLRQFLDFMILILLVAA